MGRVEALFEQKKKNVSLIGQQEKTTSATTSAPASSAGRVEQLFEQKGLPAPNLTGKPKPIMMDTSGEAWTRAMPSQTQIRAEPRRASGGFSGTGGRVQAMPDGQQTGGRSANRPKYSAWTSVRSMWDRGWNQFAQAGGNTLAMGEDALLAPIELLSGMQLGDLSDTAPFNTWAKNIRDEGRQIEEKYRENREAGGWLAEKAEDLGAATVAAAPQVFMIASSALNQGASALANIAASETAPSLAGTISRGAANMVRNPQYWSSFAQVAGNGYEQALSDMRAQAAASGVPVDENKIRAKAMYYAVGNGLMSAAVEIGGGIQKLPQELRGGTAAWRAWVNSMLEEGNEEVVQGVIERAMQNVAYDKKNPLLSTTDPNAIFNPATAAQEHLGGDIVGGILSGGQIGFANAVNRLGQVRGTPQIQDTGDVEASGGVRTDTDANQSRNATQTAQDPLMRDASNWGRQSAKDQNTLADAPYTGERIRNPGDQLPPAVRDVIDRAGTSQPVDHGAVQKGIKRAENKLFGDGGMLSQAESDYGRVGNLADAAIVSSADVANARALLESAPGLDTASPFELQARGSALQRGIGKGFRNVKGLRLPGTDYTVNAGDALLRSVLQDPNLTAETLAAVPQLQALLRNSQPLDSGEVNGRRVDSRYAKAVIGGVPYRVDFDIAVNGETGVVTGVQLTPYGGFGGGANVQARQAWQDPLMADARRPTRTDPEGTRTAPERSRTVEMRGSAAGAQSGPVDVLVQDVRRLYGKDAAKKSAKGADANTQAHFDSIDQVYNELPADLEEKLYQFDPDAAQDMVDESDGPSDVEVAAEHSDRIAELLRQKTLEASPDDPAPSDADIAAVLQKLQTNANGQVDVASILEDLHRRSMAAKSRKKGVPKGTGAADAGFSTRGLEGTEQTSRAATDPHMAYNKVQQEASAMKKDDYNQMFRYRSQTEGMTTHLAEELLYVMKDGKPTFLKDVDETAYRDLLNYLEESPAWNGEQMEAGRMILSELEGRAYRGDIPAEEYTDWLQTVREHETDTGRGVQAISKWRRTDNNLGQKSRRTAIDTIQQSDMPDAKKAQMILDIGEYTDRINAVEDGNTAALKDIILEIAKKRGTTTGVMTKHLDGALRKAMDSLTFQELKQFAFASEEALGMDAAPLDMGRAVRTIQVLNLLSSMKTPNRNLTGNTSFYALDALSMDGAAILDMALAQATGTRSVAMGSSPVNRAMWESALKSARMSVLETALDVDMGRGETMYGTGSRRTFRAGAVRGEGKINSAKNFTERVLSAMERNNSYLLTVPDEFFKGMARGHEGRLQSLIDQGKIKTDNADYAAQQADALAKYRTFQDNSTISAITTGIHDLLNLIGRGDSGKRMFGHTVHNMGLGDLASPFARVAANLAARGVDYNPVRAVQGVLEMGNILYDAKHGKTVDPVRQAKAVSHTARGLSGTAVIGTFLMMLSAGLIRRADDEGDENVAALNRSEGRTGYQFNLGAAERWADGGDADWENGDKLLDISSLQPFNELLGVADQIYHDDDRSVASLLKDDVTGLMYAAADIPMLQTVGDLTKDLTLYKKEPLEAFGDALSNVLISSITPNLLRSIAQGMDDRPRHINREDGFWPMVADDFKSRIPGLRQTLPGSTDSTGEDKVYPGSRLGNFLNSTVNPLGLNTYDQTEQSQEWERLMEATGRTNFYPSSRINKELKGEGIEKKLTYAEQQAFQRQRGGYLMIAAADMMGNPRYRAASDQQQADLMYDVRQYAHELAKADVLGDDTVAAWVTALPKLQGKTGLKAADYLAYRRMYLDTQEDKTVTSTEAKELTRNAIKQDSSLTTAQKNAIDDLLIDDGHYIPEYKDVDYADDETFAITQMSESAVKHWDVVRNAAPGVTADNYKQIWEIANRSGTKKNPYTAAMKKKDLMEMGFSRQEASRILKACNVRIKDEDEE